MSHSSSSVILLAGGTSSRMKNATPKQFLSIQGRLVAHYSFNFFLAMPQVSEIIVVCAPVYRQFFHTTADIRVAFAEPGRRRQDSVYHGLLQVTKNTELVCIHDAARPCLDRNRVEEVLRAGYEHGAAALGVPLKDTIKEVDSGGCVIQTPDRARYWSVHTPQVLHTEILRLGYVAATARGLSVTDDVSLAELIGHPVKMVLGNEGNIKLTTPADFELLDHLL